MKHEEIVGAGNGNEELVSDGRKSMAFIERARRYPALAPYKLHACP